MEQRRTEADRQARRGTWDQLSDLIKQVNGANAVRKIDPQGLRALNAAFEQAREEYERAEDLAARGSADLNALLDGKLLADRRSHLNHGKALSVSASSCAASSRGRRS